MRRCTLVIIALIGGLWIVSGKPSARKQPELKDIFGPILNKPPGRLYNCGDTKTQFQFTWTPTTLTPRSDVIINSSFIIPFDMDKGIINLTLYYDDPDIIPMFSIRHLINCDVMKDIDQSVACPWKKGSRVSVHRHYFTNGLTGYAGKYIVQAEIRTFDGKLVMCGKGIIKVLPATPYY